MKVAILLYGQPRDYLKGYHKIKSFIKKQEDCNFDFFYHCWTLNENEKYKHSKWREIDENTLIYNKDTESHLQELYNPILHNYENQNNVHFDELLYKNTIAYNNTTGLKFENIHNVLFQMYSRNKARDLLNNYINKNKINYDFVLMTRFDISVMPKVNFNELDNKYVYISDIHCPRNIIPDNCIIAEPDVFLDWFNIYENLKYILNNNTLFQKIISLNEEFEINPEQIVLANYIFHFKSTENIRYFKGGTI